MFRLGYTTSHKLKRLTSVAFLEDGEVAAKLTDSFSAVIVHQMLDWFSFAPLRVYTNFAALKLWLKSMIDFLPQVIFFITASAEL